jgi:hypothetical protein
MVVSMKGRDNRHHGTPATAADLAFADMHVHYAGTIINGGHSGEYALLLIADPVPTILTLSYANRKHPAVTAHFNTTMPKNQLGLLPQSLFAPQANTMVYDRNNLFVGDP